MQTDNLTQMKKCQRFPKCSANICPLDPEAKERTYIPDEDVCPFTIKKRKRFQKGVMTRALDNVLKDVPESNLKMLHRANQKRWLALRK